VAITKPPKAITSTPAILFIINKRRNLNLSLKILTTLDNVNHQDAAPNIIPQIRTKTEYVAAVLSTMLNPANTAAKTKTVIGFDIVNAKIEIKSPNNPFRFRFNCFRSCTAGFVVINLYPRKNKTILPPILK